MTRLEAIFESIDELSPFDAIIASGGGSETIGLVTERNKLRGANKWEARYLYQKADKLEKDNAKKIEQYKKAGYPEKVEKIEHDIALYRKNADDLKGRPRGRDSGPLRKALSSKISPGYSYQAGAGVGRYHELDKDNEGFDYYHSYTDKKLAARADEYQRRALASEKKNAKINERGKRDGSYKESYEGFEDLDDLDLDALM